MPAAVRRKERQHQSPRRLAEDRPALEEPKRSFLRVVSHELRTPLNSILGFSEILATELYGPLGCDQYREYAGIIRSSGEKLLKLVNQVVEIARLQAGEIEINLGPERLASFFDGLTDGLHDALEARSLKLVVEPCGDLGVRTDERGFRTVLSHLMQNAIVFSPEGGVILVSARRERHRVEVVVQNEGEGVDEADLARLLHPFEQGENALTRHSEGAGLGLAICDLTCQAMGGRLRLVSSRGRGFSAHVSLPTQ
jgi:signal transduction histidine kinase